MNYIVILNKIVLNKLQLLNMKKNIFKLFFLLLLLSRSTVFAYSAYTNQIGTVVQDTILDKITKTFKSAIVEERSCGKKFLKKYEVTTKQVLNHSDSKSERFNQRLFIFHKGFDKPVVFVTEGYDADYAEMAKYNHELCDLLDANLIVVEHRFYGKSKPNPFNRQFLTIEQAAADHHEIATMLKKVYVGKWFSTGTSKGGSTALYFKALYPNDVDVAVAYVAPITIAQEDPRPIDWIMNKAATPKIRKQILDFQTFVLKHKEEGIKYLQNVKSKSGIDFPIGYEATLEYAVFEYAYSFWQWGISPERIPTKKDGIETSLNHLFMVVAPSTFYMDTTTSSSIYYYQAYSETGYYSFNEMAKQFKVKLSRKDYSNRVMAPQNLNIVYRPETHEKIIELLNWEGKQIIQIHGAIDPWRQAAWVPSANQDCFFFEASGAAHGADYNNLDDSQKQKFNDAILKWTGIKVK